jgi:two-component system, OmpR family, response regulator
VQTRGDISFGHGQSASNGSHARAPTVVCVQQRAEEQIRRLVQALQGRLHHCESGGEALAVARARPLACVIAPLDMPDMPAHELIERLHEVSPGLAVIVIVDNPAVSEAVAVMRSGAHAVVDGSILGGGLLPHLSALLRKS